MQLFYIRRTGTDHDLKIAGLPVVLQLVVIKFQQVCIDIECLFFDSPALINAFWKPFWLFNRLTTSHHVTNVELHRFFSIGVTVIGNSNRCSNSYISGFGFLLLSVISL